MQLAKEGKKSEEVGIELKASYRATDNKNEAEQVLIVREGENAFYPKDISDLKNIIMQLAREGTEPSAIMLDAEPAIGTLTGKNAPQRIGWHCGSEGGDAYSTFLDKELGRKGLPVHTPNGDDDFRSIIPPDSKGGRSR